MAWVGAVAGVREGCWILDANGRHSRRWFVVDGAGVQLLLFEFEKNFAFVLHVAEYGQRPSAGGPHFCVEGFEFCADQVKARRKVFKAQRAFEDLRGSVVDKQVQNGLVAAVGGAEVDLVLVVVHEKKGCGGSGVADGDHEGGDFAGGVGDVDRYAVVGEPSDVVETLEIYGIVHGAESAVRVRRGKVADESFAALEVGGRAGGGEFDKDGLLFGAGEVADDIDEFFELFWAQVVVGDGVERVEQGTVGGSASEEVFGLGDDVLFEVQDAEVDVDVVHGGNAGYAYRGSWGSGRAGLWMIVLEVANCVYFTRFGGRWRQRQQLAGRVGSRRCCQSVECSL